MMSAATMYAQTDPGPDVNPEVGGNRVVYDQVVYGDIPRVDKCRPDVMIGDCTADIGDEPNVNCGGVLWNSPYIWVRNQQDGFTNQTNQSPISGQPNWVYVALHNRGSQALVSGDVYVYFSKASTGLYWPTHWIGYVNTCDGVNYHTYGDLIGSATIVGLASNGDAIAEIPWTTVPDPNNFCNVDAHHFCMLARFISPEDPMTYIETSSTPYNTQYNNNIAWKNQTILHGTGTTGPVDVHNGEKARRKLRLAVTMINAENDKNLLDVATVQIDLGDALKALWNEAANAGTGVENADGNLVTITAADASIEGLELDPGETQNLSVNIQFNADAKDDQTTYEFDLVQYDDAGVAEGEGVTHLVGGERYTVTNGDAAGRPAQGGGAAAAPNVNALTEALQLTVHPNPTSGAAIISYTLPADMPVTLAVYDITGKLVRTLVAGAEQKAGQHRIEWDGRTADNRGLASGTYFYRIETPRGTARSQISITR